MHWFFCLHTVPQVLHCGHCLAGHTRTVVMKCDNFGGEGNFKLFPLNPSVQENEEHVRYWLYYKEIVCQAFNICYMSCCTSR